MSIHFGGKKVKEMYWAGRKIKEAWYEGKKVYSGGAPFWKVGTHYKAGDTVTDYESNGGYAQYRCLADHDAAPDNQPFGGMFRGVYWEKL